MAYFKTADEVYESIGRLFQDLAEDEEMAAKFRKADTVIQYCYTNPESVITVDLRRDGGGRIDLGGTAMDPEVVMKMEADIAHRFWLGKVSPTVALARGQIKADGPIAKVLRLVPLVKPVFPRYREVLVQSGHQDLLNV